MLRRTLAWASTALLTATLASCGSTDSWVAATAAQGWPAQYADAANTNTTLQAGTVQVGPTAQRGDQVITQIYRLTYENETVVVRCAVGGCARRLYRV